MKWSKLKNIIILILLILNLFLLFLVGGRVQQREEAQEELEKSTIAFLKKNGIQVEGEIVPWDAQYELLVTDRDQGEEERIARMVLKEVKERKVGFGIAYSGEGGTVRFYQDGRFSINYESGHGKSIQNIESQGLRYLKGLGIEAKSQKVQSDVGEKSISVLQTFQEQPIFNCEIKLEYQDGCLNMIEGFRLMGEPKVMKEQHGLTAPTLLVRFMESALEESNHLTEIRAITQGYLYSPSTSARAKLIPVWRVETDQGEMFLNCMTGKVEKPSAWLHQGSDT